MIDTTQLGERAGETIVDEPPGTYYLDIVTIGDADYKVTVEQCEEGRPETNQNTTPNPSFSQQDGDDRSSQEVRQVSQRNQSTSAPASRDLIPQPRETSQRDQPTEDPDDDLEDELHEPDDGFEQLLEAGGPEKGPSP